MHERALTALGYAGEGGCAVVWTCELWLKVKRDGSRAIEWYHKAAEAGHVKALHSVMHPNMALNPVTLSFV